MDVAASWVPGKIVDNATSSFNKAVAEDLGSSMAATMTNVAKTELRQISKQVNKGGFQGAANTTANYTGGFVGGQAQKRMRERVNRPQSSNMDPTTVQPADATRMHKPY